MDIADAQREVRAHFAGGFYGQLVSALLWLTSASFAAMNRAHTAIAILVIGGFFIFPITELLLRLSGSNRSLSSANSLNQLGMLVAFVLPLSMPLLLPITQYRLNLFYPSLTILLGAHYCPFVFLYGMRMFGALAALLVGGGVAIAMYHSSSFGFAAWYTGTLLLVFAIVGKITVRREPRLT